MVRRSEAPALLLKPDSITSQAMSSATCKRFGVDFQRSAGFNFVDSVPEGGLSLSHQLRSGRLFEDPDVLSVSSKIYVKDASGSWWDQATFFTPIQSEAGTYTHVQSTEHSRVTALVPSGRTYVIHTVFGDYEYQYWASHAA